ncbi:phosphoglucosamine mutase [Roseibacillus ishigakijimensis]|uniref:Phosphoglucosamine mutase n=1 Tax=Roseibacillus ishigakijimensis TaxID=454146 RepID=A0A934VHR9_9BACT|nr:phosphoglucosamine mutase [Roseibacillus ishigakijimensis]MBK1834273.1 phosphoglucosamine mutase [Roseibacillus ishigakijimensis]
MKLFGTDGIRGTANEFPITPELALRVGRAIARALEAQKPGRHKVVIGKDTRISGYMLETALTSGLVSEGARVLLTGPLPTPAVAHLTKSMACDAGIMLTASHNPFMDNGIKIFGPDGFKLNDELEETIESLVAGESLQQPIPGTEVGKAFRIDDAPGRYIEFAKSAIGTTTLEGLKIVVDCAHGAGYFVGPLIFDELGAEVIPLGVHPDGRNINANCGALHPEHAAQRVRETGADLGVCLDGDADRLVLIDGQGKVVHGDRLLCLAALSLKRRGQLAGNTLVATVMSNLGLKEALAQEGIALETTSVGDRNVLERMREKGFCLGGENSGHLIFADHATTGDGIMGALQVLAEMKATGKTLAELADCMSIFPQKLVNVAVTDKPPVAEIRGLGELIAEAEAEMADSGRVLVRYSGTEKLMRVMVEAREKEVVDQWCEKLVTLVKNEIGA